MSLSDKICFRIKAYDIKDETVIPLKDVKEFIKKLKDEFCTEGFEDKCWCDFCVFIDKLAGADLI